MLRLGLSACLASRVAARAAHRAPAGPPRAISAGRGGGLLPGRRLQGARQYEVDELAGDGDVGEAGTMDRNRDLL